MKREEMAMERVFEAINGVFSFIGPLSDFLWEFPTKYILCDHTTSWVRDFFQFQDRFYASDLL